ncbi:hypothetical protein IDH44_04905 [Paenibacillus sp. IB182496]|uniref:Uncharacterized protein n=1 Tax=Paenibacillus sabuli TaxID=2772509 RepID=A0A927BRE7_9BACL|nr:hypothetical protein [Paenibacillus sabuli]MBD2844521.1 hypothetical protein [Paenibacillus sabuli]
MDEATSDPCKARLQRALELWYAAVSQADAARFTLEEEQRMHAAVSRLAQTSAFIGESAIVKADWFEEIGAALLLRRLQEGNYDCYE